MPYSPTGWVNDGPPPINAENLNKLEEGLQDAARIAEDALPAIGGTIAGDLAVDGSLDVSGAATVAFLASQGADMGGQRLTALGAPTSPSDAATKAYVDANAGGGGGAGRIVGETLMFLDSAIPADWAPLLGGWFFYDDAPGLGAALGGSPGGLAYLPDFDGRVPMGGGNPRGTGGENRINAAHLPEHRHTIPPHTHAGTWRENATSSGPQTNIMAAGGSAGTVVTRNVTDDAGGDHDHGGQTGDNIGALGLTFDPRHVRVVFAVYHGVPGLVINHESTLPAP